MLCSQVPIEFGINGKGSDINGLLGAELQVSNFSLSESWRPMGGNVHSAVTTVSMYFEENHYLKSQPYISLGYSTNGFAHPGTYDIYGYYDINDVHFYPAVFFLIGFKTIIYDISDRLSGKAGLGMTFGPYGHLLSFELSINYVLFKNKLK